MKILNPQNNSSVNESRLKLRKFKLMLCGFFLFSAFLTIGYRTISLSISTKDNSEVISFKKNNIYKSKNILRGNIYDRNKILLATTITTSSLNMNPQEILDINQTISKLKTIFPNLNEESLFKKLNSNKKHINILREISPIEHISLLKLGIEGMKIEKSNKRIYPNNSLASHVIGSTNIDGIGIAGIEKYFDRELNNGESIFLSIHAGIQHITKKLLHEQIKKFQAPGGAAIVMDAKKGEIYALASLPDYNANNYKKVLNQKLFNRATKGIYELGSTLKLITAAVAFDSKLIKENEVFDVSTPLKISSKTINDFHPLNYALNIPEVIVHSSNIGSAKIAEKFGSSAQLEYLKSLGLMDKLSLELPELGRPQVRTDKKLLTTMTISYGHGIAITPSHLAALTATIVNNGIKINPTLIIQHQLTKKERVFSKETSKKMRSIMRLVVSDKNGTAKKADAAGYIVGGKTGTAEKVNKFGKYLKNENIVALTAAFPMDDPKFIITIMIDNPKGQKSSSYYRTAGWVVAPVVKKIVTRIAPILGIKPRNEKNSTFTKELLKYKIRGKEQGANL